MADRALNPPPTDTRRSILTAVIALVVVAAGVVAIVAAYRAYTDRYTVATRGPDDRAVSMVVQSTLDGASDLKVGTLKGTVQAVASDSRGLGWINSTRVMKAPFEVEYFVDVSALDASDFIWDQANRKLIVRAPQVRVGAVNVDESRTYLDQTKGVFVTRAAMAAMQKQASGRAQRVAHDEALKPDKLAAAQRNARAALANLFAGPLKAAGIDATVEVRLGKGAGRDDRHWDVSRSFQEVLRDNP